MSRFVFERKERRLSPVRCIAIIPARGGSTGIPRKNVVPIAGKPLLAYSIEHARETPEIERVVVSTDDAEIAEVAKRYSAEVIRRPAELAGDAATSESALVHALDHLRDTESYEPDLVVFLQATSPLRRPGDIQEAIATLQDEKADSLFSGCPMHGFLWRREGGRLTSLSYDHRDRRRRQDAPEELVENGSIYIFKPWVLRESGNRLGGRIAVYRMDALCAVQVDEPGDLEVIGQLMALAGTQGVPAELASVELLVLDFDGVVTDNRVWVDGEGRETVACDRSDGWGIARVREAGVEVVVLSTETHPVVEARCRKLSVTCLQGCSDKPGTLRDLAQRRAVPPERIAYVGNDVNDLGCLQWVGVPIAVADAQAQVRLAARVVTRLPGGRGAVREVCDWICARKLPGKSL